MSNLQIGGELTHVVVVVFVIVVIVVLFVLRVVLWQLKADRLGRVLVGRVAHLVRVRIGDNNRVRLAVGVVGVALAAGSRRILGEAREGEAIWKTERALTLLFSPKSRVDAVRADREPLETLKRGVPLRGGGEPVRAMLDRLWLLLRSAGSLCTC